MLKYKLRLLLLVAVLMLGTALPAAADQLEAMLTNNQVALDSLGREVDNVTGLPLRMDATEFKLTSEGYAEQPGAASDHFGQDVAIYGRTAIVGSHWSDINALQGAGVAYIYEQQADETWLLARSIEASDASIIDNFGESVAIYEDTIVVGAKGKDLDGGRNEAGRAYVYERNEGGENNWGQVAMLTADDAQSDDNFGQDVGIHGDYIVVGAPGVDIVPHVDRGAAYIFGRNHTAPNSWSQITRVFALDGDELDRFGSSVAVYGDHVLVGAPAANTGGLSNQGAAYVFEPRSGAPDVWAEVANLRASDQAINNYFGASVSISEGIAIVGAWGNNGNAGAAYVFSPHDHPLDEWEQITRLVANDGIGGDQFGYSVSIDGSTVVVGANSADVNQRTPRGSVYIFQRYEGGDDNWGRVSHITASDGAAGDSFGNAVAVSGSNLLVGAPNAFVGGNSKQGAAYVFDWQIACEPLAGSATSLNEMLSNAQCNPVLTVGDGTYTGCFDVTHNIELIGTGARNTILSGGNICTTVSVRPGVTATFADLSITGGNGISPDFNGGGIFNDNATLTLKRVEVEGNTANFGGGIHNAEGGLSSMTVISSTVYNNSATSQGGGIYAPEGVTVNTVNSTFSGNDAPIGGAIYTAGQIDLVNTTLANNAATAITVNGGAVTSSNSLYANSGTANCDISAGSFDSLGHNLADDASCQLAATGDVQVADAGLKPLADNGGTTRTHGLLHTSPAIDAGDNTICAGRAVAGMDQRGVSRPFGSACDIGAVESNTVACQAAPSDGQGLEALTNDASCSPIEVPPGVYEGCYSINHNTVIIGQGVGETILESGSNCPAIEVGPDATVELIDLTLTGGTGPNGGGLNNLGGNVSLIQVEVTDNSAEIGGGVNNQDGGTLTLDATTIHGNVASTQGGGIYNGPYSTVNSVNSTVSGNVAPLGGGIANEGYIVSTNSTVADNEQGGVYNRAGSLRMVNTLFAENRPANCVANGGLFFSDGNNMADDNTCQLNGTADRVVADAGIRDLGQYGGPTKTHQLAHDSVARDVGNADVCADSLVNGLDQRGMARPFGAGCDVGAVESETQQCQVNSSGGLSDSLGDASCSPVVIDPGEYVGCFEINSSTQIVGDGPGETTFRANGNCAVISIAAGLDVDISGVLIEDGNGEHGGGLYNAGSDVVLQDVVIRDNSAEIGAAIYNDSDGTITLLSSSVAHNDAILRGGAVYNAEGAVFNSYNSTITGNTALNGGGLFNRGSVKLTNTTLVRNSDHGLYNLGTTATANTIIAENGIVNCFNQNTLTSVGHNLSDDNTCQLVQPSDQVVDDAGIGAYGMSGGSEPVHMLQTGSMAIDNGSDVICAADPIGNLDQRGYPRPFFNACDIGAVEVERFTMRTFLPILMDRR